MPYDIVSKHGGNKDKFEALAHKCRLDEDDEACALGVYHEMIAAVADRVANRDREPSPPPSVVFIAAYQHRFGVDLSAHRSRDNAESQLLSIAWKQCMRDPSIRAAVDARFGPLVSEEPPLEHPFEGDFDPVCGEADPPSDEAGAAASSSAACELLSLTARNSDDDGRSKPDQDGREERRRTFCEQLLEEWPDFAKGESLWIAECVVEEDDPTASARGDHEGELMDPFPSHGEA
jgi:hypothetical protein